MTMQALTLAAPMMTMIMNQCVTLGGAQMKLVQRSKCGGSEKKSHPHISWGRSNIGRAATSENYTDGIYRQSHRFRRVDEDQCTRLSHGSVHDLARSFCPTNDDDGGTDPVIRGSYQRRHIVGAIHRIANLS